MVAVGAHHEQAGARVLDLLQQDLGGWRSRDDGTQPVWGSVGGQVLAGQASERLRLGAVTVNAHDLDGFARGKTEELERLQRS
jgi:hypothetical protein